MTTTGGTAGAEGRKVKRASAGGLVAFAVVGALLLVPGAVLLFALSGIPHAGIAIKDDLGLFVLLVVPLVVCEVLPITVVRDHETDEIVVSSTFTFAVLLAFGPVPALAVQGVACLAADLAEAKSPLKAAFNVGQYWVAWGVASLPLLWGASHVELGGTQPLTSAALGLIALSALIFFVLNNALVGGVTALLTGVPVVAGVRLALRRQARSHLLMLALGPVVLVVAGRSLWLYPLVVLAVAAVYRAAAVSVAKEHQAIHDRLTDLPNRVWFGQRLADLVADAAEAGEAGEAPSGDGAQGSVAVLLIDLDRFKDVNDTLGHGAGDLLLQQVGPRIAEAVGSRAAVARLGGDEFGVAVPGVEADAACSVGAAIVRSLERPFAVDGALVDVEASIGIAVFPEHARTAEALLQRADVAMYLAKARQHAIEVYTAEEDHHSRRRLSLMVDLRGALGTRDLIVHYQPQLSLASGRVESVEALVRWQHPHDGLLAPGEFVPLAERTGLIRPLTTHVLAVALQQAADWRARGLDLAVSVNLSARNLHDPHLADQVHDLLVRHGLAASRLQLEITESSIMDDPARAREVLAGLDALGVRLAIDDFGTGYSSLAYLQRLPVDEIKIDRSFVSGMADCAADQVIVRSTIDLARNLGLTVTAEGVECERVLRLLRDGGCHNAQGHLIGPSMSAGELEVLLRDPAWPAGLASGLSRHQGTLFDADAELWHDEPVLDLGNDLATIDLGTRRHPSRRTAVGPQHRRPA